MSQPKNEDKNKEFVEAWNSASSANDMVGRFGNSYSAISTKAYRLRIAGYRLKYMYSQPIANGDAPASATNSNEHKPETSGQEEKK